MKTSNLFIAQQCDRAGEVTELEQCIASGQVSAAQIEAHRVAGDLKRPAGPIVHLIGGFDLAELAIKHLGRYSLREFDFAMAVVNAIQDAAVKRSARVQ